jgi:lipopolysaccharide export system protein LptA
LELELMPLSLTLIPILAVLLSGASAGVALAQGAKGIPNAVQGFSKNRDQPVHIEAATLEVRDKERMATFSGNVLVVQGDTKLRCKVLVVHYDNNQPRAMKAANPGAGGSQQISRLEAKGGVVVTQQDQTATGETGLFDMKANTITLLGNVTVSQGGNVVRGERLVVDMTTGVSTVDAGNSRGPVRMLIEQNKDGSSISKPAKPPLVR